MNDELRQHWALRTLDDEAARLASDQAKIPALRRMHETRVTAARRALEVGDARAASANQQRRALERDIAAFDVQEKRFEQQLAAVTDQKQFEAVQHEIAAVRAKRSDIETTALEQLEIEEQCAAEGPSLAAVLERATQEASAANAAWDAEEAAARARTTDLDVQREAISANLSQSARNAYTRLRGARDGRAIAAIENGACGACFHSLSPHAAQEARKRERLLPCDGCGRLLMLAPAGQGEDHAG